MQNPLPPYGQSLALLTDLYQLTMAYGYWQNGIAEDEAVFHLGFRKAPFSGGYAVAAGLGPAVEWLRALRFDESDLGFLAELRGADGHALFEAGFLDALGAMRLRLDVDAVPEGTAVFPHEPLLRVQGPLLQAQLVETALLNIVNFQTLVATKAARVCAAAKGQPVLEFGLRRAQGVDGALAASRAAYVGGTSATSNVLAGKLYGIPVRGTHAHSWVMCFESEPEAFAAYARAMPNNCIFLVDTYDTLEGVRHAIAVGRELRAAGHELLGVRLDSGDLAYLSREARKLLDEAGFSAATIVASNDLDEAIITSLEQQGAQIGAWGVGTKLVTGHAESALGGVYKLSAVRGAAGGAWRYPIKLSEQRIKISTPGRLQVRRFGAPEQGVADLVYDVDRGVPAAPTLVDPLDDTRRRAMEPGIPFEDLLEPVLRGGELVRPLPPLAASRARAKSSLAALHAGIKRLLNPHQYPVGLEQGLAAFKTELVLAARARAGRKEPTP